MKNLFSFIFLIVITLFCASLTQAQTAHFTFKDKTGNNAIIAVPVSMSVQGFSFAQGDEIGVYSPNGLCVGAMVWSGANTALTVWGDNDQTPELDGMKSGEKMNFRIWQKSTDKEFASIAVTFSQGDGNYSSNGIFALSGLTLLLKPSTPTLLLPMDNDAGVATNGEFTWTSVGDGVTYHIQISQSSAFTTIAEEAENLAKTMFQASKLAVNTKYFWRVQAVNANGAGEWSATSKFTTEESVSVGETAEEKNFSLRIFPNPVADNLRIRYHIVSADSHISLALCNALGDVVMAIAEANFLSGDYEFSVSVRHLSAGAYFLRLNADGNTSCKTLMIAR